MLLSFIVQLSLLWSKSPIQLPTGTWRCDFVEQLGQFLRLVVQFVAVLLGHRGVEDYVIEVPSNVPGML
jgi:hypothetical protein